MPSTKSLTEIYFHPNFYSQVSCASADVARVYSSFLDVLDCVVKLHEKHTSFDVAVHVYNASHQRALLRGTDHTASNVLDGRVLHLCEVCRQHLTDLHRCDFCTLSILFQVKILLCDKE